MLTRLLGLIVALAMLAVAAPAYAASDAPSAARIDSVEYVGFVRVRTSVVEDLLPHSVPCELDERELRELERRLWALAIFDDVSVVRAGSALRITVREKWTLVPTADFGTSKTLRDSYFLLALAEYNALGRAIEVGSYAAYLERAVSAEAWISEQQNAARRATFEGGASWVGSGIFFGDSPYAWERRRVGGRFGVRLPFAYGQRFRFALLSSAYRETLDGDVAPALADGVYAGQGLRAVWDAYAWNDVTPSGVRFTLEAMPGLLVRGDRLLPRHNVMLQALGALPLSSRTAIVVNVVGEAVSPGDPNHSALLGNVPGFRFSLGSLGGVRGLQDNVFRNTAHAYADVELRAALTLAPRWYLQGVAFVDSGVFAQMNVNGRTQDPRAALSTGIGLRLLPTAIATFVPRVDVGRRHLPTEAWFWTFGLSQYF
jgi:hypothetical protein